MKWGKMYINSVMIMSRNAYKRTSVNGEFVKRFSFMHDTVL